MKGSTKLVLGVSVTSIIWLTVLYPDVMQILSFGLLKVIGAAWLISNGVGIACICSEGREDIKNSNGGIEWYTWMLAPVAASITFVLDKADKHL